MLKRKIPLIIYFAAWKSSHIYTTWKSSAGGMESVESNSSNDHIRKHYLKSGAISSMGKVLIMLIFIIKKWKLFFDPNIYVFINGNFHRVQAYMYSSTNLLYWCNMQPWNTFQKKEKMELNNRNKQINKATTSNLLISWPALKPLTMFFVVINQRT